ncbi:MAG: hypothetical protein HY257_12730, partial [Chloroflexi bacterium]|nr:hypothetical protein [Chloroflexota bacterium]
MTNDKRQMTNDKRQMTNDKLDFKLPNHSATESALRREIFEQPAALARFFDRERAHVARIAEKLRAQNIQYVVVAARGSSDNAATYAK